MSRSDSVNTGSDSNQSATNFHDANFSNFHFSDSVDPLELLNSGGIQYHPIYSIDYRATSPTESILSQLSLLG